MSCIYPFGSLFEEVTASSLMKVDCNGNIVEVEGTTATRNGELQGKNDIYVQTKVALEMILEALEKAGANAKDVIRTRLFVSDISQWEKVGKAHGEVFGSILPATSMLQVAMIDPEIMVEIEATAIIA